MTNNLSQADQLIKAMLDSLRAIQSDLNIASEYDISRLEEAHQAILEFKDKQTIKYL